MGIEDIEQRLHEFVSTLSRSKKELTEGVKKRACGLVSEVQQSISESYQLLDDKYNQMEATVRSTLDDIQDAFTEEDLYVIITAFGRGIAMLVKDAIRGGMS